MKWVQGKLWELEKQQKREVNYHCNYLHDGRKGDETDRAIIDYRKRKNLPPTGKAVIDGALVDALVKETVTGGSTCQ